MGHVLCGSGLFKSTVAIAASWFLKYSTRLFRYICDRVISSLAQIASTDARIAFGNRKAVAGSDAFNVVLLAINKEINDVVLLNLRSGNETRRQPNVEVWTAVILITPSGDVADNFLDVIAGKLLDDRSSRMPLQLHLPCQIR
jgi:hypothetical protein